MSPSAVQSRPEHCLNWPAQNANAFLLFSALKRYAGQRGQSGRVFHGMHDSRLQLAASRGENPPRTRARARAQGTLNRTLKARMFQQIQMQIRNSVIA